MHSSHIITPSSDVCSHYTCRPFFHPAVEARVTKTQEANHFNKSVQAYVPKNDESEDKTAKQEQKQTEDAPKADKPVSDASCEPKGVSYAEFLAQSGNIDDAFGLTSVSEGDVTMPEVVLNKGVLQKTSAALQASSLYMKAQTFEDTQVAILSEPGDRRNHYCPQGRYPRKWIITPSGADKIKEGEQEHCNDFIYAFNLSLAKFRDAVNVTAGHKFVSGKSAKAFLQKKTGIHPDKWNGYFWCLARKTKERDSSNWHLPRIDAVINEDCSKAVIHIQGSDLPEIGKHPSSEIIKDCKEK